MPNVYRLRAVNHGWYETGLSVCSEHGSRIFCPFQKQKEQKMNRNKKGFTLIELLVVVLIIGILAAVALPQYQNAVEKSRVAEAKLILKAMDEAQQVCALEQSDIFGECTGSSYWENTSFTPPTPLVNAECIDTDPCFITKDWEYFSDDYLYACRIKNNQIVSCLTLSTISEEPLSCGNLATDDTYCSQIGM